MKINENSTRQAQELYGRQHDQAQAARKAAEAAAAAAAQKPDRADISAAGRLKARALDAVTAAPETRSALVDRLHAQVQSGAYTVDDQHLAGQITRHLNIGA